MTDREIAREIAFCEHYNDGDVLAEAIEAALTAARREGLERAAEAARGYASEKCQEHNASTDGYLRDSAAAEWRAGQNIEAAIRALGADPGDPKGGA